MMLGLIGTVGFAVLAFAAGAIVSFLFFRKNPKDAQKVDAVVTDIGKKIS